MHDSNINPVKHPTVNVLDTPDNHPAHPPDLNSAEELEETRVAVGLVVLLLEAAFAQRFKAELTH